MNWELKMTYPLLRQACIEFEERLSKSTYLLQYKGYFNTSLNNSLFFGGKHRFRKTRI